MRLCSLLLFLAVPSFGGSAEAHFSFHQAFEARDGIYVAYGQGYSLTISPAASVLDLGGTTVGLRVVGGSVPAKMDAFDRIPGRANYFLGGKMRKSFPLFSGLRARDVYPGIDLVFRRNQQNLEYDFEVAAGLDPRRIAVAFEGAERIRVDRDGALVLQAGEAEIRQPKPSAYQVVKGRKRMVDVRYRLDRSNHMRFDVGPHDASEALVIDPQLVFENTFGGSQATSAAAIALDPQGNIYVVGSQSQPNNSGFGTAFVSKWSPDGSQLLYSTNFGGSVETVPTGIAVDSAGSAYVTGYTRSPDFPVTSNAFQQSLAFSPSAFVTKLSPDGSQMVYSTLLGGAGSAQANGIAVDSGGNAIVAGETQGNNFPVTPNALQSTPVPGCPQKLPYVNVGTTGDAFVTKLDPDGGSLVYSTLLGGSCATSGQAVTVDSSGNAWVTGNTQSSDFPVTAGALQPQFANPEGVYDGFLAQFTAEGGLAYASYLGGGAYDTITGIALDSSGSIFLAGVGGGPSQLASSAAFQPGPSSGCGILNIGPPQLTAAGPAFLVKLAPNAASVSGLTYLGGGCVTSAIVAVDASDAPWIAGSFLAGPTTFLPTASPFQIGIGTGFVSKFSPDLTQLLFSTYFDEVNGLALDSSGFAYIAGAGPLTTTQAAFVAKIDPAPPAVSLDQVLTAGIVGIQANPNLAVAPGEVLRLTGKNMGPSTVTPGIVNSSAFVTNSAAGVQVTFGGVPAPLLSVSAGEIDCVAPFEIASNATTTIQVLYNGAQANPVLMPVVPTAVEVLAVLNEDFTLNSASNPASPASILELYLAGAGQTNPPSQDGQVNQTPLAQPGTPVQVQYSIPIVNGGVTVGGTQVNPLVTYAGAAPGLIAGVLQVNFAAPQQSAAVYVQVGSSFINFSVAIQ